MGYGTPLESSIHLYWEVYPKIICIFGCVCSGFWFVYMYIFMIIYYS